MLLVSSLLFYYERKEKFITKLKITVTSITAKIEDSIVIKQNKLHPTSDIDLVYTWVDGNDKNWQKEKAYWAKKYGVENKRANNNARYIDNEELRYSLRSAEKNAPWVNKIYIVTNGQIPKWLNTNHPKIQIITHEQIMPKDALPTFNSMAIEANLAHIPNLSEKFLYANDDMFFGRPVSPDYFFTKKGKIKVIEKSKLPMYHYKKNSEYFASIQKAIDLINLKYNKYQFLIILNHGIIPYLKSYYLKCEKDFQNEFSKTTYSKFRTMDNVNHNIVAFYIIANEKGFLRPWKEKDSAMVPLYKINFAKGRIRKNFPKLICLNDMDEATTKDRIKLKALMQELWPDKSSFEK